MSLPPGPRVLATGAIQVRNTKWAALPLLRNQAYPLGDDCLRPVRTRCQNMKPMKSRMNTTTVHHMSTQNTIARTKQHMYRGMLDTRS